MPNATDDARKNRDYWDRTSDDYQKQHGPQLNPSAGVWGVWDIPEDRLRVLGEVVGKDILELGCGAAQWSIYLARRGARMVGLDNSGQQLEHARRLLAAAALGFPLIQASAENLPFADESFDVVFCDHGAISFTNPEYTVPEATRVLRPGGLLAFNRSTPLVTCCWDPKTDTVEARLLHDYFGLGRYEDEEAVEYELSYGDWIRLFRQSGLVVEDLIELQPPADATTTYDYVPLEWARRWPAENIWKVRRSS